MKRPPDLCEHNVSIMQNDHISFNSSRVTYILYKTRCDSEEIDLQPCFHIDRIKTFRKTALPYNVYLRLC